MAKIKVDPSIRSSAVFSECGKYRYILTRGRDVDLADDDLSRGTVNFLMCNPSIADCEVNDPTIHRAQTRAFKYGIMGRRYSRMHITNLFAVISTDPKHLMKIDDPIGEFNDAYILAAAAESDVVVLAWGDVGARYKRPGNVLKLLVDGNLSNRLYCLGVNESGHPAHPLMLSYKQDAVPYRPAT